MSRKHEIETTITQLALDHNHTLINVRLVEGVTGPAADRVNGLYEGVVDAPDSVTSEAKAGKALYDEAKALHESKDYKEAAHKAYSALKHYEKAVHEAWKLQAAQR